MRFSRSLKSSAQSLPSPNGIFIATIASSKLSVRDTRSLETIRVVALPPDLTSSVQWFLWSETSNRVLVASKFEIRVYAPVDPQFSATITNPTSGTTLVTFVTFGASDNEICVFSEFGLKLSIFNLLTSKSVEINAPKLYNAGVAAKGVSYRPLTKNLAILTRSGGKDIISVHEYDSLEIRRSWVSETIDSQGVTWSPDGRWLVTWESASQGHKFLVYTTDGHLYHSWNGPAPISDEDVDISLGAGIKLFEWSKAGAHIAIADYSNRITVITTPAFTEAMNLLHTASVTPSETLQIWQEQIMPAAGGGFTREFIQAATTLCPPTSASAAPTTADGPLKAGTNLMSFDRSGSLLASRLENMPSTLWIWDVKTNVLRAIMIFHAPIAKITWHPTIDELILIRCEGDDCRGLVHFWDSSWEQPTIVDFAAQLPGAKVIGKTIGRWLGIDSSVPSVYFSDTQDCLLASFANQEDEDLPWQGAAPRAVDIYGQQEESPLNLVAAEDGKRSTAVHALTDEDGVTRMSEGSDDIEDTFRFRKFVEPSSRADA